MSKNNYKVYVHINKINGKKYYGITKQEVKNRWANGKGYSKNEHFTNSINKYGWDNFEHIIVAKGLTEDEAKWLEIELIREHDTTNRDKGYNLSLGGEGGNHTEETRKKISEAMKGKTHTEEARKKMSEAKKGHEVSEETRRKFSEAMKTRKGKNSPRATKVYCIELNKYFDTITEACEYVGCSNDSNISMVLNGKRKTAGGYHWLYAEDVNQENINRVMSEEYNTNKGKATKVYCVELDMYFDTVTEASKFVGCHRSNISAVLIGRYKTTKGYHWIYAEDVEIENSKVS